MLRAVFDKKKKRKNRVIGASSKKDSFFSIRRSAVRSKESFNRNPFIFFVFILSCFVVIIWARLGYLQIIGEKTLGSKARRQHQTTEYIMGKRGSILDRQGKVLARSIEMRTVSVQTSQVQDKKALALALGKILKISAQDIENSLQKAKGIVLLARRISDEMAQKIKEADLHGVSLTTEYGRVYPYKDIAGKLLGFVGDDGIGLEGIEYINNAILEGGKQKTTLLRDAKGKKLFLAGLIENEDLDGKDVRLTIDMNVQHMAEEALEKSVVRNKAQWGGVLVVKVDSGDILAFAEYPRFNPNTFKRSVPSQWRNRLAVDAYEPGSSFKPFLIAAVLEEGLVTEESLIFCEGGSWKIGNSVINDDTGSYQWLTLVDVLARSSNIGMSKLGLTLGQDIYQKYLTKLGFGVKTQITIPQSAGIMRSNRYWSDIDIATLSFGQGIAVTGLQLAQGFLILANGGVFQPLRLFMDTKIEEYQYRIFSENTIKSVHSMLRNVVENGTGKRAYTAAVSSGGKTGTAQKANKEGGYGDKRFASFVGMFPIEKPQYIVVVLIDEPLHSVYGSVVASPVFKDIASQIAVYAELSPVPEKITVSKISKNINQSVRKPLLPKNQSSSRIMPNITGKTLRSAVESLAQFGIIPIIHGNSGIVLKQVPEEGAVLPSQKASIEIWLSDTN
ncbi:MAG: penicillin-binding transpeptidase domain-containing protein [Desulfovibrionaceae bacterium]